MTLRILCLFLSGNFKYLSTMFSYCLYMFIYIHTFCMLCLGVTKEYAALRREVAVTKRQAYSKGTSSNLMTQFRQYFLFCEYFGLCALPASLDTLCTYAQFLSRSITVSSIRNYLYGVKLLHVLLGLEYPFTDNFILRLLLRGLDRLHPHVPRRAPPMTPSVLLRLAEVVDTDSGIDCVIFAVSLFLFFFWHALALFCHRNTGTREFIFCVTGLLTNAHLAF